MTILKNRKWENDIHKVHFESGVRMGIGTFNLVCICIYIYIFFFYCDMYYLIAYIILYIY